MSPLKGALFAATLLASAGGIAFAQSQPTYDPAQLPTTQGKVAQYTLTPRGAVDGFILQDGTEVHVSPRLSTQLVFAVRPGDEVTIHGLKARAVPMVMALSVTNDATHATVEGGAGGWRGPQDTTDVTSTVKAQLHGPRGEMNGVLLQDGTIVRLPPPEAERLAAQLAVGQPLYVAGPGITSPLGRVIDARSIGPSKDQVTAIRGPRPGDGRFPWARGRMAEGMRGGPGAPGGAGPMGAPPPPPPRP